MQIINPKRLKRGDLISIISPSAGLAPFAMHRIEVGKKELESMGLRVKIEKNALGNDGYVSASVSDRVKDIHNAFSNKEVKAIICTIGGNHSNQLLRYIDWDLIKNNPKIFVGYSDITVLHQAIAKKTGLRTFYGPCIMSEFGEFPQMNEYTLQNISNTLINGAIGDIQSSTEWTDELLDWFTKDDLNRGRIYQKNKGFEFWKGGKATGLISGGSIPSINHLAGTEYWNSFDGKILFIDLPEGTEFGKGISVADVATYLASLDNMHIFDNIVGLIIGRAYKQSLEDLQSIKELFLSYAKDKQYPVLYGVDIGHTSPMITLPFDAEVIIDSSKNLFSVNSGFLD